MFAITGSTAGRISSPVMNLIGLDYDSTSGWLYWPLRIVLIFPLYQILLLAVAWIFGQYKFFYQFEKKMLSRMGLGFLFTK
ncbi:MAG: diacylglyceryl transferase [Leeuwenhoekiella sp.]|nr:diacylglyceryl transferase [Leeuwenhoekiella sp.]